MRLIVWKIHWCKFFWCTNFYTSVVPMCRSLMQVMAVRSNDVQRFSHSNEVTSSWQQHFVLQEMGYDLAQSSFFHAFCPSFTLMGSIIICIHPKSWMPYRQILIKRYCWSTKKKKKNSRLITVFLKWTLCVGTHFRRMPPSPSFQCGADNGSREDRFVLCDVWVFLRSLQDEPFFADFWRAPPCRLEITVA